MLGRQPLCGPRTLQLNICDNCNLDCIMCNRSRMPVGGIMPFENILEIVQEVYSLGLREIYFHGYGEPFMHPRILDVFETVHLKFPKLRQFIVTNGTFLSERAVEMVVRNRVGVRVSLHAGDPETWRRINPGLSSDLFEKAVRGMRHLAELKPEQLEVLFVILKENYDRIAEMVELSASNGIRNILFRPMRLYKNAEGRHMNDHLMLSREQHAEAAAAIQHFRQSHRSRLSINASPFEMSSYMDRLGRPSSGRFYENNACLLGWVFSLILKDGTVLGCLEESFDMPMGNIFEKSFREIWWSDNYRRFRRQQLFAKDELCSDEDCRTWCQHLRTNRRLNLIRRLKFIKFLLERKTG
jgi:radical SAM protein with 4Fe4S-binding SPASM domain